MSILKNVVPENLSCELIHWKNRAYFRALANSSGEVSLRSFDRHQSIFIHIPKSGGVSVSKALFGVRSGGHSTVTRYKKIFGLRRFYSYFKFCFVRNPYTRLLSAFNYFKKGGFNKTDAEIGLKYFKSFGTLDEFVKVWFSKENIWKVPHLYPQTHFISNAKGRLEVDFIGRYENLYADFQLIAEKLQINTELEHHNRSRRTSEWEGCYSSKSRAIVSDVYRRDFELLNYNFS